MSLYLGNEQIPSLGISVFGVSSVNGETGDITGLATEAYVDSAISSIPAPDMSSKQDKLTGTEGQVVGFDANGNAVAQEAPEAVTSWNDLTDKPFGETATGGDTIYMPDDLSGLESVETTQGTMYKISNITPTIAELESTDYLHPGNEGIIRDVDGNEATYYIMSEADNWAVVSSNSPANTSIIIAYKDNASTMYGVLPSSGMYAPSYGATCTGFASLTITGFTDFPDIKKLDSKYLDFNIDDYKNAILLDGESLKNTSGEDITEDVKAVVDTWGVNSVKLQIPKDCYSIAYGDGKFVSAQYGSTALIYSTDGIHWNETNQVTTRNENWSSIAYGNNIFIAISNGVTTAYSVDGINWNTSLMSNAFDFPSVAYGNGVFVLVGKYSSYNSYGMLYSTDGINWTNGNNYNSKTNWNSVTYGNGMFVAVASSNVVMYSTDGINWNTASIPFGIWNSVTYGNGMFVATAALSSNIAYSVDGINWSICDDAVISLSSAYLTTYGNGTFIAIGNDNSNGVFLYSTDGTTWNSSTLNCSDSLGSWMSVTYGNGMFVAINTSGICAHSTNGINWTTELKAIETASGQDITNDIKSIVAPATMTGATSDTNGASGLVPTPVAGDENKLLKGDGTWTDDYKNAILLDGETLKNVSGEDVTDEVKVAVDTWRANIHKVNFPTKGSWNKIVCGNGKIVVTDNYDYRVACSNDDNLFNDINWSITSTGSESKIAYGNGKFVITRSSVSTSAGAAYSTDGINWTDVTLPIVNMFTYIGDVTYGNDKFVAIAKSTLNTSNFQTEGSAKAAYSLDGINWTETAMPTAANWCCVVHGNDKFVALSQNSNMAAYSLDGISWTEITLPQSVNWKSITYGNGKFVAIASNGAIIYSMNGIEWNETTVEGITSLNSVTYGNGRFVAIDFYSNIAIYSDDGIEWHKTNLIEIELEDMVGWVTVAYCNDCFIATTGALSNIVAYSRDGINWFGEVLAIETASGSDITDKVSEILGTSIMVGANADLEAYTYTEGKSGFVPAPHKYDYNLFLRGDGTWANPNEAGSHYTDTFYTLSSSNWTEQSDGSYAQSVSIMSVTVDNTNIVDCRTSSDKDANIAILQGWGCVNDCKQSAGTLTFYCYGDAPTVNIPINVVVM